MKLKLYILLWSCFLFSNSYAQKIFSEGNIKYDVYIDGNTKPDGIYVISVKGGMIKRELAMNNGYDNITIYNQKTGKTLSLNVKDEQKYALEITEAELKEKNKRFLNAVLTDNNEAKKIAGYACKSVTVKYENQDGGIVFYTSDFIPQNETFNTMFPGLKGIPLEYETKSSANNKLKFVATLVETKVLESNLFVIPDSYKIVTKEELQKLNR